MRYKIKFEHHLAMNKIRRRALAKRISDRPLKKGDPDSIPGCDKRKIGGRFFFDYLGISFSAPFHQCSISDLSLLYAALNLTNSRILGILKEGNSILYISEIGGALERKVLSLLQS